MKSMFLNLWEAYVRSAIPQPWNPHFAFYPQQGRDFFLIDPELDKLRCQLAATPEGLQFLIDQMENIKDSARLHGSVSADAAFLILVCCGIPNELARRCFQLNLIAKGEESETEENFSPEETNGTAETSQFAAEYLTANANKDSKSTERQSTEEETELAAKSSPNLASGLLVYAIDLATLFLREKKSLLMSARKRDEEAFENAAIVPTGESDRFSRAETALERLMYRALTMLLAVRQDAGRGSQSPQLLTERLPGPHPVAIDAPQ